jgi:prephenate dehydrogenase
MTIQLTIVGLGQIGTSIGMALAQEGETFHRVGHDRDMETARRAQKLGAVERVVTNLPSAVREADIVILAVPADQIRPTLEIIAQDLKENAVVMDTSPAKVAAAAFAKELLPDRRHYVGLTPVINPAYLRQSESGIEAAHADLFQRGLMAIVTPPSTSADALQLAADLVRLLGAAPLFADLVEIDGLVAATYVLPQLMAAALVNATVDQPGWREARKITDQTYAHASAPSVSSYAASSLGSSALMNRENVVRVLDGAIAALQDLRDDIAANDAEALQRRLESAWRGYGQWLKERMAASWTDEGIPEAVAKSAESYDVLTRLFGTGWKRKGRK